MSNCICIDCPNANECYEFCDRFTDKGYYEWTHKQDRCSKVRVESKDKHFTEEPCKTRKE